MRRVLRSALIALSLVLAVMALNAWRVSVPIVTAQPYRPTLEADAMARRLAAALAIPTLSATPEAPSLARFDELHALLQAQFPRVHAALTREIVSGASLLYRWRGRSDCAATLLAAHQDVVPVEPGTEALWRHPPFAGVVAEGAVWGRGAIDDKSALMAILEAVDYLLARDVRPECDVWLAFGHDEEVSGLQGARAMAALLQERGVQLAYVLDEGGAITLGAIPGTDKQLATIGVAEKGYVSVRLIARDGGGHSSMPPRRTAIGRLARAVARLEEHRPAADFSSVQREMLRRIAPHVDPLQRVVLSNLWITAPLVERLLSAQPASDATLRTTTAPTMLRAGIKDNVLAQRAEAVVNFRVRIGDSIDAVLAHVRTTIDDADIEIAVDDGFRSEPSAISSWEDAAFLRIERVLHSVSPESDLVVAPYVTSGGTDARHYAVLTPNLYRFLPVTLTPELLASFHGNNERIPIDEYVRMVRFYLLLLQPDGAVDPQRQS
ncbi:MAG: M20/M25/M40 family metallo-hydrolase [Rhodanobacteraceae bacterium]|nr:M20/M25/M40 family metallo-hydrolase [Rhodanobacteraceae bacterium]